MTTRTDLIEDVLLTLNVNVGDADSRTHLTSSLDAAALTFTVNDATKMSEGIAEIGEELLWVSRVDRVTNAVTVESFGRGFSGTTAAAHSVGNAIVSNPRFTRGRVKSVVDQVIQQIYPDIFVVKTDTSITWQPARVTYPLPADVDFVLNVTSAVIGPSGMYAPVRNYYIDRSADTAVYPTGRTIDIDPFSSFVTPGRKVKVVYTAPPTPWTTDSTTLADIGLAESVRDVLSWGAAARLLQAEEATRVQTPTQEQAARDQAVPVTSSTNVARAYYALFQQRLQEEGDQLRRLYPAVARAR